LHFNASALSPVKSGLKSDVDFVESAELEDYPHIYKKNSLKR